VLWCGVPPAEVHRDGKGSGQAAGGETEEGNGGDRKRHTTSWGGVDQLDLKKKIHTRARSFTYIFILYILCVLFAYFLIHNYLKKRQKEAKQGKEENNKQQQQPPPTKRKRGYHNHCSAAAFPRIIFLSVALYCN